MKLKRLTAVIAAVILSGAFSVSIPQIQHVEPAYCESLLTWCRVGMGEMCECVYETCYDINGVPIGWSGPEIDEDSCIYW